MKMRILLFAPWLGGCSPTVQMVQGGAPPYEYGEMRNPFPVAKTDPVVPPAGAPAAAEEAPAKPKVDPCIKLCDAYSEANEECGSRTSSCMRIFQSLGSTDNDTCRDKDKACKAADVAEGRLGKCACK